MDTGILHTHHLLVVLYTLLLAAKVFLVIVGNRNALVSLNGRTRMLHIALASLMLATGVYGMLKSPEGFTSSYLVKYFLVLGVIALGVVGIKRMHKPISVLALVLMFYVYGIGKTHDLLLISPESKLKNLSASWTGTLPTEAGKQLYVVGCQRCHGSDGQSGYRKAKNLATSRLSDDNLAYIIRNGQKAMPAFDYLSTDQTQALVTYVKTLRK
jgi:cytochrome c553